MARKLSLQERESINYITDVLCHALPAAQRSFAGSLASALVRVKGDQVTDADLVRATEKFGEYQSALIEVAKAKVLDRVPAVDAKGDGEAFTLRVPESLGEAASEPEDAAVEASAAGEKPAEPSAEAAAEPAEKKPARRRRTRRKKAAEPEGEAEVAKAAAAEVEAALVAEPEPQAEDAAEAVEPEPEPEAKKKSVRPGRGARAARAKAKAEAAEKAAEKAAEAKEDVKGKKSALPAAKEAPALPEAAAAAAESEAGAASAAGEATSEVATEASSASTKEAPKKRTRRRRTKKPVEDIVVKGPEAEQLLAKEAAAVEAEAAGEAVAEEVATQEPPVAAQTDVVANEPQAEALLAEKGDTAEAVIEPAEEPVAELAAVEPPAAEVTAEPAADEQSNGRPGGRARVRGRGRRGLERRSRGDNLSDVPYVRRGGESETALREQIVQLDPRLWMNGWLLSHPGAFTLYERELRGIDAALQEGELPGDLTRRQLAYKMGGNEKFFEYGADGHKLLRAMGADDLIGHRLVPKADMLYHVPRRRKSMKILVTENLDPWLDVRDLMYEDGRSLILGERVHGVVLGGGNPVIENNRLSGLLETLGAETIEVLYWGDIDRAGLNLLQRLQAMLEGRYKVTPFMPAYRLMLERAMERYPDPDQNERTTQDNVEVQDYSSMLEGLSGEQAAYFSSIIQKCGLIPQEILTKQDL